MIRQPSVTPDDKNCQDILAARLSAIGFRTEEINSGEVRNLWAVRGQGSPHLLFAGHTDVVPPGPLEEWTTDPFAPEIRDEHLFGRGAADMKSGLAAMIVALEEFVALEEASAASNPSGTISLLITSDEEGIAIEGTRLVVKELAARGVQPDYCIVGEPSSSKQLGDVVRCGRRGSINATLTVHGIQGHVAYPETVSNPIHSAAPMLAELAAMQWDAGNNYFPPTSLQISNIHAGTGATNVVPGDLEVQFNLRFSTEQTAAGIEQRINELLQKHPIDHSIDWQLSGNPFLTEQGYFTDVVTRAIKQTTGIVTELSTSGGTSDGRFIAPWARAGSPVEVIELGPCNATIHKINESVAERDLGPLASIYQQIIQSVLNESESAETKSDSVPAN